MRLATAASAAARSPWSMSRAETMPSGCERNVGLVANGTPPGGLFGNEFNAAFSGPYPDMYHLDTPGNNIMQASISFSSTVATGSGAPFFNELITAYLQQRTLTQ